MKICKNNILNNITEYLLAIHFNEGYIVNHNNIKEMIILVYLDDIAKEVFKKFKLKLEGKNVYLCE